MKRNIIKYQNSLDLKTENENSRNEANISKEIEIIDKILKLFPEIKNKRDLILTEIVTPKKPVENDYILEKIVINGEVYYKDKHKCILNSNINIVGIWEKTDEKYIYHIFANDASKIENMDKRFQIDGIQIKD